MGGKSNHSLIQQLKISALRALGRREHSRIELRIKLLCRAERILAKIEETPSSVPAIIDHLLDELEEQGWLNEKRFVTDYINVCRRKHYGPLLMQAKLTQHGIAQSLIADCLPDERESVVLAAAACQKKFGAREGTHTIATRVRTQQINYLQKRGFTMHTISTLFRNEGWE